MSILVTGSTGNVGSIVTSRLAEEGADVKALTRSPEKHSFPKGVTPVKADMIDIDTLRSAFKGVRTVFLLNPVAPDELSQALFTVNLAREAGIERFVYLSVIQADRFTNVPHFASKYAVERMFEEQGISASVLRPGYYIQNDTALKEQLYDQKVYSTPLGNLPILAVDVRDLAEVAVQCILKRDKAEDIIPHERIDVVAPQILTGRGIAEIWTDILGEKINYGGDDLKAMEQQLQNFMPGWMAYDMRLMMERFQNDGIKAEPETAGQLQELLGRPMRSYKDFAKEMVLDWSKKQ